jgi:hypothetical protein
VKIHVASGTKPSYGHAMTLDSYWQTDNARIWLSVNRNYGRVGGRVNWVGDAPERVEFLTGWPVLRLRLVRATRRTRLQTAMQIRKSSWHAHLPHAWLGVPEQFMIDAAGSRSCLRRDGDAYAFDFTGMSPLPQGNGLERRAAVLLEEIENFRRFHPDVLDRLGIQIEVRFQDDSE